MASSIAISFLPVASFLSFFCCDTPFARLALKNRRRHQYFNFNFSAKRAKLTCRCFLRLNLFFLFAAFRFDEKRHSIRKVSASPVSADSALAIFQTESEITVKSCCPFKNAPTWFFQKVADFTFSLKNCESRIC